MKLKQAIRILIIAHLIWKGSHFENETSLVVGLACKLCLKAIANCAAVTCFVSSLRLLSLS